MAGYGATARLDADLTLARRGRRVRLEPVRPGPTIPLDATGWLDDAATQDGAAMPHDAPFEEVRAIRAPTPETLHDLARRLRELWTQTTFYLFSPDSWR